MRSTPKIFSLFKYIKEIFREKNGIEDQTTGTNPARTILWFMRKFKAVNYTKGKEKGGGEMLSRATFSHLYFRSVTFVTFHLLKVFKAHRLLCMLRGDNCYTVRINSGIYTYFLRHNRKLVISENFQFLYIFSVGFIL